MSCNIFFQWFVTSFVYYGLSFNTSNLGGDIFINFLISAAVQVPGTALAQVILTFKGRRLTYAVLMAISGLALILVTPIPTHLSWLSTTFAMIGKLSITGAFIIIYLYTSELYPTVIRNVGLGCGSVFARVGAMIAPFAAFLGEKDLIIPMVIFGVLSLLAGVIILLLPETRGRSLPETIKEGEIFLEGKRLTMFRGLRKSGQRVSGEPSPGAIGQDEEDAYQMKPIYKPGASDEQRRTYETITTPLASEYDDRKFSIDSISARHGLLPTTTSGGGGGENTRRLVALEDAFRRMDTDGDGTLSRLELGDVLVRFGIIMSDQVVDALFDSMDKDSNCRISVDEFIGMVAQHQGGEEDVRRKEEMVREAFELFDEDSNGRINTSELTNVMRTLNPEITDDEVNDMIREADLDGDGEIDYNEFRMMMTTKSSTLNIRV